MIESVIFGVSLSPGHKVGVSFFLDFAVKMILFLPPLGHGYVNCAEFLSFEILELTVLILQLAFMYVLCHFDRFSTL